MVVNFLNPESSMELELRPGERYGWWEEHESEGSHKVDMVHRTVNTCRTRILLDTEASVSMIGLDLARRFKLKLRMRDPIRVSGLGGVPTHISASARIKITIGPRIVYIMSVYVASVGEGVEVLLGMNFMHDIQDVDHSPTECDLHSGASGDIRRSSA
jgi:predicted aspartyl protease